MVPGEVDGPDDTAVDGDEDDGFGDAVRQADAGTLPTLRVFPHGISRKRLEQAIRDLQLPVIVARDVDEADVAMTLRSEYRQKPPPIREAEERAIPVYVLKSNTIVQMQASLTSIFSLEVDPREAALRETEQAIGLVIKQQEPDRAVAAERVCPAAAAPDGRAREPRVPLSWPRAVPARPPLPGSRPARLALEPSDVAGRASGPACARPVRADRAAFTPAADPISRHGRRSKYRFRPT